MKFSVIVPTYDTKRINDLDKCIRSILKQSYKNFELIVVVDHNPKLFKVVNKEYTKESLIKVILNSSCRGLAGSINFGILQSRGQVMCFIDDDAVADENWLKELLTVYENSDAYGVGGRIVPLWLCKEPIFLSKKVQWLVGSTDSIYPQQVAEVRNLWTSNTSFKRGVFKRVGLFSTILGRHGSKLVQGEDAEFGLRCIKIFGEGMIYNPNAIVYHKVYPERVRVKELLNRAFKQGYSKGLIFKLYKNDSVSVEKDHLRTILLKEIPSYIEQVLLGDNRVEAVKRACFILLVTFMVLTGFLQGWSQRYESMYDN